MSPLGHSPGGRDGTDADGGDLKPPDAPRAAQASQHTEQHPCLKLPEVQLSPHGVTCCPGALTSLYLHMAQPSRVSNQENNETPSPSYRGQQAPHIDTSMGTWLPHLLAAPPSGQVTRLCRPCSLQHPGSSMRAPAPGSCEGCNEQRRKPASCWRLARIMRSMNTSCYCDCF